ncbi:MAG: DNA polymerase I, partial [Ilumatobacteraceae bacterium]
MTIEETVVALRRLDLDRGALLALAIEPGVGVAFATRDGSVVSCRDLSPVEVVRRVDDEFRPRWVVWGSATIGALVAGGLRVRKCWDISAVQRLLVGGWRMDAARAWAGLHDLGDDLPTVAPVDLFTVPDDGDPDCAVRDDGHVKPEWLAPDFEWTTERLEQWARLAAQAATLQEARVSAIEDRPRASSTVRSESAAELLCAELSADGLPMDRGAAESLVASFVGPRPKSDADAAEQRRERDSRVLSHATNQSCDLRNPGHVKSLLRGIGVELPDTRAWRLEAIRGTHPLIDALLEWRKA